MPAWDRVPCAVAVAESVTVTGAVAETETVTGAESVAVTESVTEAETVGDRACDTDPGSHLTPPPHTPKGPGCAPDVPYDEPDRSEGPF